MLTLDEFTELAEAMIEEIPEEFLKYLNGGINIVEEAMQRDDDLPDVYILGEYFTDEWLGRWINLYYGSFVALFKDEPAEVWEDELWETILHELRHHIENLAGLDDLDREDAEELARFRAWLDEAQARAGGERGGEPEGPALRGKG